MDIYCFRIKAQISLCATCRKKHLRKFTGLYSLLYIYPLVLLSNAEAHQCKWAALVNWKGGENKNIEIDLLQENRNKDIKGLTQLMGANKTEKAIQRMSKAAGGVSKIINVFEDQALIKPKSSMHSHKSSSEDEKKFQVI